MLQRWWNRVHQTAPDSFDVRRHLIVAHYGELLFHLSGRLQAELDVFCRRILISRRSNRRLDGKERDDDHAHHESSFLQEGVRSAMYCRAGGLGHFNERSRHMAESSVSRGRTQQQTTGTREQLIELLNEDLSREYQAVIAYVVYSQIIKGAAYTDIARELETHAKEELDHALKISKQIDYLGGTPSVTAKPVK